MVISENNNIREPYSCSTSASSLSFRGGRSTSTPEPSALPLQSDVDKDNNAGAGSSSFFDKGESTTRTTTTAAGFFSRFLSASALKTFFGFTLAVYVLNQKALLPKPFAAVVSKVLFWPTLPITVGRRIGKWKTVIDDVVVMGGAPFSFAHLPESLYHEYSVRGVVNMCDEYRGPVEKYRQLGMRQLHLPTVDHFAPDVDSLERAVHFIQLHRERGMGRVYVHCRAGHGRSAAAVFAWLLSKNPNVNLKELNEELCQIRYVKPTLWRQPSIIEYQSRLLSKRRRLKQWEQKTFRIEDEVSSEHEASEYYDDADR